LANSSRPRSVATYASVSAFSSASHLRVSAESMSSSQRYGSATLTPWCTSTTSPVRAGGYTSPPRGGATRDGAAPAGEGAAAPAEEADAGAAVGCSAAGLDAGVGAGAAQPSRTIANGIRMAGTIRPLERAKPSTHATLSRPISGAAGARQDGDAVATHEAPRMRIAAIERSRGGTEKGA
jgi:hypothetical protein